MYHRERGVLMGKCLNKSSYNDVYTILINEFKSKLSRDLTEKEQSFIAFIAKKSQQEN